MSRYEDRLLQNIGNAIRQSRVQPTVLGGRPGSDGGAGGPPGGFIGYLPQTRVAYDLTELAVATTSGSGTMLDNLNHIRYRIHNLENVVITSSGVGIELDDTLIASGVTTLNFEGDVTITEDYAGKVTFTIVASGTLPSGYYTGAEIDALLLGKSDTIHTHTESDITDLDHDAVKIQGIPVASGTPVNGDTLVFNSGTNKYELETTTAQTIYQQYLFTIDSNNMQPSDIGVKPFRIYAHGAAGINATIDEVFCSLATAPTATGVQINVLKNGVTIFSPPSYAEIPVGNYTVTKSTGLATTTFTKNDYFNIELVRGDVSAEYLTVHLRYHW